MKILSTLAVVFLSLASVLAQTDRGTASHLSSVNSVSYSPNGEYIVSSDNDGKILLWEVATGKIIHKFYPSVSY